MAKNPMPTVSANSSGFQLESQTGETLFFPWGRVKEVRAYKLDRFTTDEIRLDISMNDEPSIVTLSEEMPGFESFRAAAEARLGFPPDWWGSLIKPAFATNMRVLYRHA